MRWGARRPRLRGSRWPPVPSRPHCRQAAVSDPVPGDHPSASWAYCAVGLISSTRDVVTGGLQQGCRTHQGPTRETNRLWNRRTNPHDAASAPEDGVEQSAEATHRGQRTRRPKPPRRHRRAALVEDHPTEVMAVESTGCGSVAGRRRPAERRFTAPSGMDSSTQKIESPPEPATEVLSAATGPSLLRQTGCATGHSGPRRCAQTARAATQLGLGGRADSGDRRARRRRDTRHPAVDPRLRFEGVAGGQGPLDDPELRRCRAERRPGHPAQHHLRHHPRQLRQL